MYESHLEITKTQARAKKAIYWPNMKIDIKAVSSKSKIYSPTYPRINGLAERVIRTDKQMLKMCIYDNKDLYLFLYIYFYLYLLEYINSPIIGLGATPSQSLV